MTASQQAIGAALEEAKRLRKNLKRSTKQVGSDEETQLIKATAHAWFNNHRKVIISSIGEPSLKELDDIYCNLLKASNHATSRSKYVIWLKQIKDSLIKLESNYIKVLSESTDNLQTDDAAPQFSSLIADAKMQGILANRWDECVRCIVHEIPLAACIMMGGMLEGLLLAKINQVEDKSLVFKAKNAPKDKKGNTLDLKDWGLKDFIDVAHELSWISRTAKDISDVLRDYRNYIHPQKEFSHDIKVSSKDAKLLWEVTKNVVRELIKP